MVAFLGANPTIESKKGTASTFTHTLLAGTDRMVVVFAVAYSNRNAVSCSYGGVAMNIVADSYATSGGTGSKCQAYFLAEADLPADGANTIAPTWAATEAIANITLYTFLLEGLPDGFVQGDAISGTGNPAYPATVGFVSTEDNSAIMSVSSMNTLNTSLASDIGTQTAILEIDDSYDKQSRAAQVGEDIGGGRQFTWSATDASSNKMIALAVSAESLTDPGVPFAGSRMGIV